MSAIRALIYDDSKRWLAILAVTAAASVIFVAYSFIQTLAPPEPTVVAPQKSTPALTEGAVTSASRSWNAAQVSTGFTSRCYPSGSVRCPVRRCGCQRSGCESKEVHRQADYLRNLISQGKLPEGLET